MSRVADLKVRIFADGADYEGIVKMSRNPMIKGFTTNPTLMRKAGVSDYEAFARKVLATIPDRPVSFEVFADDFASMAEQARTIASWGPNVNVKIPVTDSKGHSSGELLRALSSDGVMLNVTAIFTLDQVRSVADALNPATPAIVSVFAGRIADTGIDPIPHMLACKQILGSRPKVQLLWASTRELLNIFHAEEMRVRHRHGAERVTEQARSHRQRPRGIFARDGAGVLSRCSRRFLSDQDRSLRRRVKESG